MPVITLSIGSNIDPVPNISRAVAALRHLFPGLRCSTVYESEAVGFEGDNFLNLAALAETDKSLDEIVTTLKQLEDSLGRDRDTPKFSGRSIDVDILTYGDNDGAAAGQELPREEITRNAYVLRPLAELIPDETHPPTGKTYAQLWAGYDKSRQRLWPVQIPEFR